ncbi:MAG: cation:proton antiporter [Prevotella sp.]|nr:cation:proton antiporter [Prevotella sp.]
MMNLSEYFPITDPTLTFLVVMLIILSAPIIMGKLRIPHIIGMVLAGVLIGKYGLNILERDASFEQFGKVGLYYIMFLASLEMDIEGLRKNIPRMTIFGLLSFLIPFILTYFTSVWFLGYSHEASFLLGSLMASNTLIAYPIIGRYGLQRKPSVTISVGGSMLALLLALICLAALEAAHGTGGGFFFWVWFAAKLVVFVLLLMLIIPRLTRWFLRRYSDAVMQFIFVMSMLFMSAALSEAIGLEGIVGAFLSGLILNRYIPPVSPLMNRIEFIGNAIFIPYFLIGVGMLINLGLLFKGGNILWVVLAMVFFGTVGKALASYLACLLFRLPLSSGHMMFGLTSAHAAGAIAIVMVGMQIETAPGQFLIGDDVLNGVIIMILFTCIISTLITEQAAQQIIIRDKDMASEDDAQNDDERMLIPVKYPEYAPELINLAILMRNPKLNRGLVAINVVYDDTNARKNQEAGTQLLEKIAQQAAASDVRMQTQVRIAANIANGIKHAFKEFRASEILLGLHGAAGGGSPARFWGQFHQSLFNGLNRQIIMARLRQPLSTIRRIQVAVPSRAQFEPGFYRWLERLARLASNLECRIQFHGRSDTLAFVNEYMRNRHPNVRAEYLSMPHWNALPQLAATIAEDHLFVVVTARRGTVSYKTAMDRLPDELIRFFSGTNMMIIFPDQFGDAMDEMTFAQPQHTEELSAYDLLRRWISKYTLKYFRKSHLF